MVALTNKNPSRHKTPILSIAIPLDRSTERMALSHCQRVPTRKQKSSHHQWMELVGIQEGIRIWETALPIRSRSLFFYSPAGMKLLHRNAESDDWDTSSGMKFNKRIPNTDTWNMSSHSLKLHRSPDDGHQSQEYAVLSKAEQREQYWQIPIPKSQSLCSPTATN